MAARTSLCERLKWQRVYTPHYPEAPLPYVAIVQGYHVGLCSAVICQVSLYLQWFIMYDAFLPWSGMPVWFFSFPNLARTQCCQLSLPVC